MAKLMQNTRSNQIEPKLTENVSQSMKNTFVVLPKK